MMLIIRGAALAAAMLWCACDRGGGEKGAESAGAGGAEAAGAGGAESAGQTGAAGAGSAGPAGSAPGQARVVEQAPPARLYDEPVERRLYADRIEASSFLWTDWNKFQENYHPNYILDGDPATAWVEGADSSGAGEWVRVHLSPVEGASRVRLRIRNGYHKSRALHRKNARLAAVEVRALPSGARHTATLEDTMGWQEIAFDMPAARLEAIELLARDVVEGSRYTDLCVSDLEIFVTGLTVENPAFEKAKLEELLAWKRNRIAAATILGGARAGQLPILAGYRVEKGPTAGGDEVHGTNGWLRGSLAAIGPHAPAAAASIAVADASLAGDFAGWVPVQVVARPPLELPEVDGLRVASNEELVYGPATDAFHLPGFQGGVLLRSDHLSAFDTRDGEIAEQGCKAGTTRFRRPPRAAGDGPALRQLLVTRCVAEETREGDATYTMWQLLVFDEGGRLLVTTGPGATVQVFEWAERDGGPVVAGGVRVTGRGEPVQHLRDARIVARD